MKLIDVNWVDPLLRYQILSRAVTQLTRRYRSATGAVAVGFGRRQKRGVPLHSGEWCIKFVVLRKLRRPGKNQRIPATAELKITVNKRRYLVQVKTDVVAFKPVLHQGLGAPIYNVYSDSNFGSACTEMTDGKHVYILTAGHVAARNRIVSPAVLGEEVVSTNGIKMGTLAAAPTIGKDALDAALIQMSPGGDAALPRLSFPSVTEVAPKHEIGSESPYGFKVLSWRSEVDARFVGWYSDFSVEKYYAAGKAVFKELIHFEAGCVPGDSGAVVVDSRGRAAGMHIMGTDADADPSEYVALAVPMVTLCAKLSSGAPLKVTH